MTGHQAKGLSELYNWSPRDVAPRRGQSKSRGLSAVLCFGLRDFSDPCCDSFFICSKKLTGKFYPPPLPLSFLGLLLFSLEIIKLLPFVWFADSQKKYLISLANVFKGNFSICIYCMATMECEEVWRKWCSAMCMFWAHGGFSMENIRLKIVD